MVGRNTGANKFAFSKYIVTPTLGDGGNYSSVQSAIDEAFVDGGGEVLVKPGTYTENLTLRNGVNLIGATADGRLPPAVSNIVIDGNITWAALAAGFEVILIESLGFACAAGDLLTMSAPAGANMILGAKFCNFNATAGGASRAVVMNPAFTGSCQFSTDNTQVRSSSHCIEMIGAGTGSSVISLGVVNSDSGDTYRLTSGAGSLAGMHTQFNASTYIFNGMTANGSLQLHYTDVNCGSECAIFSAGAGQLTVEHSSISSSAVSGFWVDGTGGTLNFSDVTLNGIALAIGPLITQFKSNWQPYAEASAAAVGSIRGTSSFDSASFSVTDGFVQATGNVATSIGTDSGVAAPIAGVFNIFGGPGVTTIAAANDIYVRSVEWTDIAAPTLAVVDNGYFDYGSTTITLPAAPAQGEQIRVISVNSPSVLQASGAQTITLGNTTSSPGGAATGTDTGDVLVLIYNLSADRWMAESVIGTWILT